VVRYDPSHTPLKGHSPIFLYGGWNRNTHKEKVREEMVREGDGWYSATLNVPQDACMLDFQIINRQGRDSNGNHGVKDDNHKRGYHVPIFNKNKREKVLHVVHVAVELAPVAKVYSLLRHLIGTGLEYIP
jgi:hypothetical protein